MNLSSIFNKPNVTYKITSNLVIEDGQTLWLPEGATLDFQGGSISGGTLGLNGAKILPMGCVISDYITSSISGGYRSGQMLFNTAVGKPMWYYRGKWVDANGNPIDAATSGPTSSRPTGVKTGFAYQDTTLGKLVIYNGATWIVVNPDTV